MIVRWEGLEVHIESWLFIFKICILYSGIWIVSLFFRIYFICLKSSITERDVSSTGSLPKWLQQPRLGQAEARNWEPGASSRSSILVYLGHVLYCFPGASAGSRIRNREAETQIAAHMDCWHYRQLCLLHYSSVFWILPCKQWRVIKDCKH